MLILFLSHRDKFFLVKLFNSFLKNYFTSAINILRGKFYHHYLCFVLYKKYPNPLEVNHIRISPYRWSGPNHLPMHLSENYLRRVCVFLFLQDEIFPMPIPDRFQSLSGPDWPRPLRVTHGCLQICFPSRSRWLNRVYELLVANHCWRGIFFVFCVPQTKKLHHYNSWKLLRRTKYIISDAADDNIISALKKINNYICAEETTISVHPEENIITLCNLNFQTCLSVARQWISILKEKNTLVDKIQ